MKQDSPKEMVLLGHGSGGRLSKDLFEQIFLPAFANEALSQEHDGAILPALAGRLAFSTDSYVVQPLFFPGGDIGDLAVNGTVNDLAMCGARPLYLSVGMILEEGLPLADLKRIVASMALAAQKAGVKLVTGDTKVVQKGKGDGVFINTSGIGVIEGDWQISPQAARPGDAILINGDLADHGVAVMSEREGLAFETSIVSDTASLAAMTQDLLKACPGVHVLRDPTRGGLGATLNEIAHSSGYDVLLQETQIPIKDEVRGACGILGLDPLYIANEGKMLVVLPQADAAKALEVMQSHPEGRGACQIGQVVAETKGRVLLKTKIGSHRLIDMPAGEQLPRIC